MHLLVRRATCTALRHEFGSLQDEICLEAITFCKQATLFLLAFKREGHQRYTRKCVRMLKRFGTYEVQYHFQHDSMRKAMSPRIFADIQRRKITDPLDRLPIVANSCNYAIRITARQSLSGIYSVALCSLAMFLLNGELLRNSRDIKKLLTEMDCANYLQYISFNKFEPPVAKKQLSYLKGCRFHKVFLNRQGRMTSGHLWTITGTLLPSAWPSPPRKSQKFHRLGLNDFQCDSLHQLADILRAVGCVRPASAVEKYLDIDSICARPTAAKRHMDLMAESVVEAMRVGLPLQVACTQNPSSACGIFVDCRSSLEIFTSWHAGIGPDGR